MTTLLENEKIEDLLCDGLKIIQSKKLYRFNADSVILANCLFGAEQKSLCEIGAGSGVISLLATKKYAPKSVVAVEVQQVFANMCTRSVELNGLCDKIKVVCCDVSHFAQTNQNAFDVVVCNPPYRKVSKNCVDLSKQICTEELLLTLPKLAKSASLLLKEKGTFVACFPYDRLDEMMVCFKQYNLPLAKVLPVCSKMGNAPRIAVVWAIKGSNEPLEVLPCLVELDQFGKESEQMKRLVATQRL